MFHSHIITGILGTIVRDGTKVSISDTYTYGFFGLLCHYCMVYMEKNGEVESFAQLIAFVSWCLQRFRQLYQSGKDDTPKMVAIRRHTLRAWQATTSQLNRSRLVQRDKGWKRFSLLWQRVGDLIPPVPDMEADEAAFEVLQRCGWGECLCSVHKPAHRMKICKGCWVVAYCGPRCQKNDWENGGHQKDCRKYSG
ncbi:uncharacterized protein PHACADRAFT_264672 [Phanerochaete carnosa HHB-10118-sp]|uniref:MYND-type domain-containing protein n=1 Tax=Phanerochaete carnosa (strain HHB-10118-sp) TaxID=650164 RepID=K5VTJ0_PHACS|nr:uncharacterized protein PHACADRAFT_264672 [Phanerochaete carnosa HHB-10118-sp]EKM50120.1 hypothetical protein PHACADRAFT_264672 [Phanerochaete carnosa HHB-10118-sp]